MKQIEMLQNCDKILYLHCVLNTNLITDNLMNMNKTSQTNMINNISCESYNHILTNFRIQATVP